MDIVIKNLCKKYNDVQVLKDYNQVFKENEIYFIMGSSGIGKTTLVKILAGLEEADSGTIENINDKKLSIVFQDDALCENLSVILNIKLVCSDIDDSKIVNGLEKLGLSEYKNKRVRELSGGMKRRVAILRAILYDFDLLIMDEPFKGLDLTTKSSVIEFVKEHIKNKTVIIITHDISDIDYFDNGILIDINSKKMH